MITAQLLVAIGVHPTAAKLHAPHLQAACDRFGIDSPTRQAAFVGQCVHETQKLTALEENLYYSTPERIMLVFRGRVGSIEVAQHLVRNPQRLANYVYANRYGNGNEASGDGWKYRGRGGGHLTFRANYEEAARALGRPYVEVPELVSLPEDAALTFAHYWATRGCSAIADAWDINAVTRLINPGMAGHMERYNLCEAAIDAFRRQIA